jgi:hypothetical protein
MDESIRSSNKGEPINKSVESLQRILASGNTAGGEVAARIFMICNIRELQFVIYHCGCIDTML